MNGSVAVITQLDSGEAGHPNISAEYLAQTLNCAVSRVVGAALQTQGKLSTVCNVTAHASWNLGGGTNSVLNHNEPY